MVRLLIVRHGHVEAIDEPRFRGRAEIALSGRGKREAAAAARRLGDGWRIGALYASPLGRCVATAAAIAGATGVTPKVLPQLIDLDYGDWTGRSHDEVRAAEPEAFGLWMSHPELARFPGGETLQDLAARAAEALRQVLPITGPDAVVLVTHDSVCRALILQLLGLPLSAYRRIAASPCGISEAEVTTDGARVLRANETAHLSGIG